MTDSTTLLRVATRNKPPLISIESACQTVAQHYYGERGQWCYKAFEWINATLFSGELPYPLLLLGLTAHGACLGWTASPVSQGKAPTVLLHPSLWGGTEKENPWKIPPDLLGPRYAFDVLIHECIHVSVNYLLGGFNPVIESSHDNDNWIAEINRIAPLIGLSDVQAAKTKVRRKGKKIVRECDGNIPFRAAASFPHSVRELRGELDYYRDPRPLPFECYGTLHVTGEEQT
jgi:hypothetical protein